MFTTCRVDAASLVDLRIGSTVYSLDQSKLIVWNGGCGCEGEYLIMPLVL